MVFDQTMRMHRRTLSAIAGLAALLAAAVLAGPIMSPADNFDVQKLATNVYAVIRKEPPGMMVDANNLFIIGPDHVIVVDANGAPGITRAVLAALRTLTDKPVRYVINTHYHDDHIRGNSVYRDAFRGVEFVAQSFAKTYLPDQGAVNRKNFLEGAPQFLEQLQDMLKNGKGLRGGDLSAEERTSMASDIELAGYVLSDGASAETVLPTITVDDRLTLESGARTVEIRSLGAGHTAADLVVWLPEDRIVAAGDLVAWPIPLVGDPQSHPASWSGALEAIQSLRPLMVVPGHGPVLRETSYLTTLSTMFRSIADQTSAVAKRGGTLADARKTVALESFRKVLAGDSPVRQLLFDVYVAQPAVGAAYKDAGGKL